MPSRPVTKPPRPANNRPRARLKHLTWPPATRKMRPHCPVPRGGRRWPVVEGPFCAMGGFTATGTIAGVAAYNVDTRTWRARAPLPAARQAGDGAALVGGLVYAPGGYDASNVLTK